MRTPWPTVFGGSPKRQQCGPFLISNGHIVPRLLEERRNPEHDCRAWRQPDAGAVRLGTTKHSHPRDIPSSDATGTIADAIVDRFMQQTHRFTLIGDSLRQAQSLPKKEAKPDRS